MPGLGLIKALFQGLNIMTFEEQTPDEPTDWRKDEAFSEALLFTLQWEGGFVNHPHDPGGATNRGITQATYNAFRKAQRLALRTVAKLTNQELEEIYRSRYWRPSGADRVPFEVAIALFDFAVNSGVSRAVRYLQREVGAAQDGKFGSNTEAAVFQVFQKRGMSVVRSYIDAREQFLRGLRTFRHFGRGWMNRINALRNELGITR